MSYAEFWELEVDSPEWLPAIIRRLLSVGVGPTAIANAFDIEVQPLKDMQAAMHTKQFGTAELAEGMHFLIWQAYADALEIIKSAPLEKRMRFDMALLARASSIIGGQQPEGMSKLQADLDSMMSEMREADAPVVASIYETNPLDAPVDDPEKGFAGRPT